MPSRCAVGRAVDPDGLAVDADLAAVGLQDAVDDVHQGGFSRAVLAGERMDFSRMQIELAATQRADRAKGFGDVGKLQKGRRQTVMRRSGKGRCAPPLSRRGGRLSCGLPCTLQARSCRRCPW